MTISNQEKLLQAQNLLKDIFVVSDDGEAQQIKYINFETFTAKQAKKKKINESKIFITESTKWGKSFYSLTLHVIIEEEKINELKIDTTNIIKNVFS